MNAPEKLAAASAPQWAGDGFMASLGAPFVARQLPQALPEPHWVAQSDELAAALGWQGWLDTPEALALLAGNLLPPAGPWASVYSGHQFGVWAGQLGDGRALLLGEAETPLGRLEVQIKGSGLTPYSRMGDGRAVLRSSIREFLCSEAMHALGIPTTRALALVGSPLPVRREQVESAAVVTRIAPSFLRFGHFEHFAHTAADPASLRRLLDAVVERYFPELADATDRPLAWLHEVARRTAMLIAQWQAVGFCHGVMNTDNLSILGLTIDYGPFGFLDRFDPGHICNHSDHSGRYAYARQPQVAFWNLHALAHALVPLLGDGADVEPAIDAIEVFREQYATSMLSAWRGKLGLLGERDEDRELADSLLGLMATQGADFTITWRSLSGFDSRPEADNDAVRDCFVDREAFDGWALRYRERLAAEASVDTERAARMRAVNPRFVLRNHLAESAIRRAREGDFSEVQRLHRLLARPFDEQPGNEADAGFPPPWAATLEVSCSS